MNFKIFLSVLLVLAVTLTGVSEAAYDLPKIKIEKKHSTKSVKKEKVIKSDWENLSKFKEKMKKLSEDGRELPASSSERAAVDSNLIFVAFYNGEAYFLDKYSIKVINEEKPGQTWEQHIFPLGEKISGKNSRSTSQKFHFENQKFYNSSGSKNSLDEIENIEDKTFLRECFRVGYYYAFREEVNSKLED